MTRREFLRLAGLFTVSLAGCSRRRRALPVAGIEVNDVHAQLSATRVRRIEVPNSTEEVRSILSQVRSEGAIVSVSGGRHASGGQQFGTDAVLLDTRAMNRVLHLDREAGQVEAEAGVQWPWLVEFLHRSQVSSAPSWSIAQKQTGTDRLCLGGALSANAHGHGLRMKPIIADVEAFTLVDADGAMHHCSRTENEERFRLVIGGYGLFGVIGTVTLRLARRRRLRRVVERMDIAALATALEARAAAGAIYGDFQYSTDERSSGFLTQGVMTTFEPVPDNTLLSTEKRQVTEEEWNAIVLLAHTDKARAFREYTDFLLKSSGEVVWSDTHQFSGYPPDYHRLVDRRMHARTASTEVLTELYVPRWALAEFMSQVAADFRRQQVNVIYGTVRLIEKDSESFLAWAKQPYACVIFNLHTPHTEEGIRHTADACRRLIDRASALGGSYYLTYHAYASPEQLLRCYPQFPAFLQHKLRYDPAELLQSDWYRRYRALLARA